MADAALVWFRNDLRLADNPALTAALQRGKVHALFVHETDPALRARGAASRWWLHHSLNALASALAEIGIELEVETGPAQKAVLAAAARYLVGSVTWNRRYAPAERDIDTAIKHALRAEGIAAGSYNGHLLVEPWDIATGAGKPYSVYTPFWNALRQRDIAEAIKLPPQDSKPLAAHSVDIDYVAPDWSGKLQQHWTIGETAALTKLEAFLGDDLAGYAEGRDFPARSVTSRLSPHLALGEISPRQVWHAAQILGQARPALAAQASKFLSELAWREFNYHQLYHREDIATVPMQPKYAGVTWRDAKAAERDWQRGLTGFPIVDAGMRELWATGFMQNRVRMLTASLLAKNLLIDWRHGERWFWDCLVDADPANNPGNWQWVAGTGLDASPYFRIFNPVIQGERFDAEGAYVREWVPELAALPDRFIHNPSAAPAGVLGEAGIALGSTYPMPIVDLKASRQRALDAAPRS